MDPYALLELEPGASEEEIKKAWRRLARVHHPDLNADDPEAEERFKRIKVAYDSLMAGEVPAAYRQQMDDDWLDLVEWMVMVRERVVLGELLPRFIARYGTGTALLWALHRATDLQAAAEALPPARPQRALRRLKLEVILDDHPGAWRLASIERRRNGTLQLVLFAGAIWQQRPKGEEALRELVFATVDHGLAAVVTAALELGYSPATLEEAQLIDRRRAASTWLWRGVWGGVAALMATMAWIMATS